MSARRITILLLLAVCLSGCANAQEQAAALDEETEYLRGVALMEEGQAAQAIDVFLTLISYADASQYYLYCEGLQWLDAAEYARALANFTVLAESGFRDSERMAAYVRAREHETMGQTQEAVTYYLQAAVLDSVERAVTLQNALMDAGTTEGADGQDNARSALPTDPPEDTVDDPSARMAQAFDNYLSQGGYAGETTAIRYPITGRTCEVPATWVSGGQSDGYFTALYEVKETFYTEQDGQSTYMSMLHAFDLEMIPGCEENFQTLMADTTVLEIGKETWYILEAQDEYIFEMHDGIYLHQWRFADLAQGPTTDEIFCVLASYSED